MWPRNNFELIQHLHIVNPMLNIWKRWKLSSLPNDLYNPIKLLFGLTDQSEWRCEWYVFRMSTDWTNWVIHTLFLINSSTWFQWHKNRVSKTIIKLAPRTFPTKKSFPKFPKLNNHWNTIIPLNNHITFNMYHNEVFQIVSIFVTFL